MKTAKVLSSSLLVFCIYGAFSAQAFAAYKNKAGLPNPMFARPVHTVEDLVLGRSCLSLKSTRTGLSCNPAQLADEERKQFRTNLVVDDNFSEVYNSIRHVNKDDKLELVREVFAEKQTLSAFGKLGLWYQDDWWAVSFTPVRGALVTNTTNRAYPQVDAIATRETELLFRSGLYFEGDAKFRAGLDVRYVSRDFLDKSFELTQAIYNPDIIDIQHGRQLYIEPGFIYGLDSAWASEISATITNWAAVNSGTKVDAKPIVDIGLSSVPDFLDRRFRSTLHFSSVPGIDEFSQRLGWSGIYAFTDVFNSSFTLADGTQAIGFMWQIESLVLGAGFKNEKITPNSWQSEYVQSTILEMGLSF